MSKKNARKATEQDIIAARVRMLVKLPFFGVIATKLEVINATKWCGTCATDGRHLYFNEDFMGMLGKREIEFVLAHEVLHCIYDHMDRRGSRDPRLWNCAADYAINLELVDAGFRMPKDSNDKDVGLLDERFRDMTANEIYDIIKKESDEGKFSQEADSFDEHLTGEGQPKSGQDGDDSDVKPDPSGVNGPVPLSEEDRANIEHEIQESVQQAAKQIDPEKAGTPGRIKKMLHDLSQPKISWSDYLHKQISSSVVSDYTWKRPNRKTQMSGVVLPSTLKEDEINVVVGVDTSGSINEKMFSDFISEVHGIMAQFTKFNLYFFCWDAECYTLHEFNEHCAEDILTTGFEGGGGNDGVIFVEKFLEEKGIIDDIDNMVMFTDGHILGPWDDGTPPVYADKTTWVIWGSGIVPPWGQCVPYEVGEQSY